MKTFDGPEAAAAPSIAVSVLIGLVHLVYIAYFIHQLVPELRIKISELYAFVPIPASLRPLQLAAPKPYYRFTEATQPDVWFEAAQVWEVKAADFSLSPVYSAAWGLVDQGKGVSLRFPRFLKVRADKSPEDATSSSLVAQMYSSQSLTKTVPFEDDDY
jgi:hypothetical protein